MRKISSLILGAVMLTASCQIVLAQNVSITLTSTPTPTPQAVSEVQYTLPYPGILPDSPLYFLKALRDNLIGMLISDPVKKADYDLLMADKRLVSAQALFNEGNMDLSFTTLSKSGNYFDQAIQEAALAKQQGENAGPTISRLILAAQKHQEIILQMEQGAKKQIKIDLGLVRGRVAGFQQSAEALNSK